MATLAAAAMVTPMTSTSLHLDPGHGIELTSGTAYPVVPYSPGEIWGGDNPVEHCNACDLDELLANNKAQSLQSGQPVDPATGDFTTTDTVFSIPVAAGFFGLTLNYDAERADSEGLDPGAYPYSNPGPFGFGWQSNFNTSVYNQGSDVQVNEDNGSEVQFQIDDNSSIDRDGCPDGDYDDTQKYTVANSIVLYCAADRVDAQMGYTSANDYVFDEQGGAESETFNYYGQLIDQGNNANNILLGWGYDVAPGTFGCPSGSEAYCDFETTDALFNDSRQVTLEFNSANQPIKVIAPDGESWAFEYNTATGQLSNIIDVQTGGDQQYGYAEGFPNPYYYDMNQMIDPDSNMTDILYGSNDGQIDGMVSGVIDPSGAETTYSYQNNLCATLTGCFGSDTDQGTTVGYPDGETDADYYQGVVLLTDIYGSSSGPTDTWGFEYAPPIDDQDGPTTETVYFQASSGPYSPVGTALIDPVGNVVYYTDDQENISTYNFYNDSGPNDLDELCWTVQNASGSGTYDNSKCNDPPTSTNQNPVTSYTYDNDGHVLSETDPNGGTTRYGYYDANSGYASGQQCWEAEPTVTATGSVCASGSDADAPTGSTVDLYDPWGNLGQVISDFNSSTEDFTYYDYDLNGDKTYEVPPDGVAQGGFGSNPYETQYVWGSYGQLRQVISPADGGGTSTTSYTYNEDNNVLTETTPASVTSTAYDADGRKCWVMVATTAADTNPCTDAPTSSGTQSVTLYENYVPGTDVPGKVVDPNGNATTYAYGDPRFPTSVTETTEPTVATNQPATQTTFDVYDPYGNVCLSGPGSPPPSCSWSAGDTADTYDLEGQLQSTTDPGDTADPNGVVTDYTYGNPAYPTQPTTVVHGAGTSNAETTNYGYDTGGLQMYSEDNEGHYVSETYDADGRMCWQADLDVWGAQGTCPGTGDTPTGVGVTTYAYNGNDHLSTMVDNNGTSAEATTNIPTTRTATTPR